MAKFQWFLTTLCISAVAAQNAAVASPAQTAPSMPHWVGPLVGKPIDNACYRKTYITTNRQCGTGYNFDGVLTCWTQCPIEYPVECGMECIQQNKDCTKEILGKVTSVANVAINVATSGVFGQISKAAKGVQIGVRCGQQLFNTVKKITALIDEVETGGKVDTTKDQIVFAIMKSDFAVYDLPAAVATCIGVPIPSGLDKAKEIVDVVKTIVDMIVNKKLSGVNLLDFQTFLNATKNEVPAVSKSVSSLSPTDEAYLKNLVNQGITCGTDIYSIVNKIVAAIQELKTKAPTSPVDVVKFAMSNSDLVLKELPAAASTCVNVTTGFTSRDEILKTVHTIIDKVVEASSQNGNPVSTADYAITITNMGLDAIALFDPTGIAAMASEFIQPICGPTAYIGDIDDGPADKALGLRTVEKAFRNSTGTWTAKGDGQLKITFTSVDDLDVRVNIMSGGQKLYEVPVKQGTTVVWTKPLSEFQGKTLYLDRWRAGFFGIPGTGGGSLLVWVPNHAASGSLDLQCKINPTSFSDHSLRRRD
jgi:hypothetical protein